jgi:hypothetical protein
MLHFPNFQISVIYETMTDIHWSHLGVRRLLFANNNGKLDIKSSTGGTSDKKSQKYLTLVFQETILDSTGYRNVGVDSRKFGKLLRHGSLVEEE